jgi:hypothetical protein
MEIKFFLNLDWRKNRYRKFGLWCNPFSGWAEQSRARMTAESALSAGIPKSLLKRYVPMLGLSMEVVRVLQKNTLAGKRYTVTVNESGLTLHRADA